MARMRRRPYPYDMVFNGTGVMLGRQNQQSGLMISRPQDQSQVAPTDYGYNAANPMFERVDSLTDLVMGFGWPEMKSLQERRYWYGSSVDTSVEGFILKGPAITDLNLAATADTTYGISHFFELRGVLYALNGSKILKRTNDSTWSAIAMPATYIACDVVTHMPVSGGTEYAYIASLTSAGAEVLMCRFDGTATPTVQAGSGAENKMARAMAIVGEKIYRANGINQISTCETELDPWPNNTPTPDTDNWSAENQFVVGDASSAITRMAATATGVLVIFKTDGIYSLGADGEWINMYPYLKLAPSANSGKAYGTFLNDIYVAYGDSLYAVSSDFGIDSVGPEKLIQNNSALHGPITSLCGHQALSLYASIWNPDTSKSYMLKMGAYVSSKEGQAERMNTWHGSLSAEYSSKITAMWKSAVGHSDGHSKLWIGFANGNISHFILPCTPNPSACSSYLYTTADAIVYLPAWTAGFQADPKHLKAITLLTENASTVKTVTMAYKKDSDSVYTAMTPAFNNSPSQKLDFPNDTAGARVWLKMTLGSGATNAAPRVIGMGLHYALRPALLLSYDFYVICDHDVLRRDGSRYTNSNTNVRTIVRDAANLAGSISVITPDEVTTELVVIDYQESPAWYERTKSWKTSIKVTAVESSAYTAPRGLYSSLELRTYAQLETLTYTGLEVV